MEMTGSASERRGEESGWQQQRERKRFGEGERERERGRERWRKKGGDLP